MWILRCPRKMSMLMQQAYHDMTRPGEQCQKKKKKKGKKVS